MNSEQSAWNPSTTADSGHSAILPLVEQYLEELERGGTISFESWLAREGISDEIARQYLKSVEFLHGAAASVRRENAAGEARMLRAIDAPGEMVGDFRIIRKIGQGGMGIVYEAEQISLARRVALKVLPFASMLDQRQLQRFRRESQAAAQLHHSNIVPIHAVGMDRGVHFYAMQYIEGRSLAELIRAIAPVAAQDFNAQGRKASIGYELINELLRTPTVVPLDHDDSDDESGSQKSWIDSNGSASTLRDAATRCGQSRHSCDLFFRSVAQLAIQATEALDHAHSLGIVHRDVKPANLLLDVDGKLWITDFGLAKFPIEDGLTVSGDMVGTLRYMSPQQIRAKRSYIDHRTDIYSLGATIYELLTLTPMFESEDRQELIHMILDAEPVAPRKRNSAIPVDLETIILKATAKRCDDRYATAGEMADDLKRFLENKPIAAIRPSIFKKIGMWSKRHRGVVAAISCSLLICLIGLSVSVGMLWQEQARTKEARNEAVRNFQESESNLKNARKAVDDFLAHVVNHPTIKEPGNFKLRKELLDLANSHYQQFMTQKCDNAEMQLRLAGGLENLAYLFLELGSPSKALDSYEQKEQVVSKLLKREPDNVMYQMWEFDVFFKLAAVQKKLGRLEDAKVSYERAVKVPFEQGGLGNTALAKLNIAMIESEIGDYKTAMDIGSESQQLMEKHLDIVSKPDQRGWYCPIRHNEARSYLADLNYWKGETLRRVGSIKESIAAHEQSFLIRWQLANTVPPNKTMARYMEPSLRGYKFDLANSYRCLAELYQQEGSDATTEELLKKAQQISEKLVNRDPASSTQRSDLAFIYESIASLRHKQSNWKSAEEYLKRAVAIRSQFVEADPAERYERWLLSCSYYNLGEIAEKLKKLDDSAKWFANAVQHRELVVMHTPVRPEFLKGLADARDAKKRLDVLAPKMQEQSTAKSDAARLTPMLNTTSGKTGGPRTQVDPKSTLLHESNFRTPSGALAPCGYEETQLAEGLLILKEARQ